MDIRWFHKCNQNSNVSNFFHFNRCGKNSKSTSAYIKHPNCKGL